MTSIQLLLTITFQAEPGQDEVASLFSRVTYSFLDEIVFYAWRVADIGIDDMPRLPQRESADALIRRGLKARSPIQFSPT